MVTDPPRSTSTTRPGGPPSRVTGSWPTLSMAWQFTSHGVAPTAAVADPAGATGTARMESATATGAAHAIVRRTVSRYMARPFGSVGAPCEGHTGALTRLFRRTVRRPRPGPAGPPEVGHPHGR